MRWAVWKTVRQHWGATTILGENISPGVELKRCLLSQTMSGTITVHPQSDFRWCCNPVKRQKSLCLQPRAFAFGSNFDQFWERLKSRSLHSQRLNVCSSHLSPFKTMINQSLSMSRWAGFWSWWLRRVGFCQQSEGSQTSRDYLSPGAFSALLA